MNRADVATMQAAQLDEVAQLFDAYRQFYGQDADLAAARRFLAERLENGESVVLVATIGEKVAGFTQLFPMFSTVRLRSIWVLNDLFVAPDQRRSGVGTKLLQAAEQHARNTQASRLDLATQLTNQAAQALYIRNGWELDTSFAHFSLPLIPH